MTPTCSMLVCRASPLVGGHHPKRAAEQMGAQLALASAWPDDLDQRSVLTGEEADQAGIGPRQRPALP
jgi:hypothetical protein